MITAAGQRASFRHGAHNLVLEILRTQGLVSGVISLTILYLCFLASVRAYMTVPDPAACLAAIAFTVGGLVNGVGVGHLLETGTGFMLYSCAGIAMGSLARAKYLEATARRRTAFSLPTRAGEFPLTSDAARGRLAY
jgi:O-antigen ligase